MILPPPLSRPLAASAVPTEGLTIEVVAAPFELEALAAENEVVSVERLVASLEVLPLGRDGLTVRGTLEAEATRLCVVTLEPFAETMREEIEMRFAPESAGAPQSDDPPDPLVGGAVDLGVIAAEHFTLGLDPHPRKPGVSFETVEVREDAASPFAALRALTAKPDKPK